MFWCIIYLFQMAHFMKNNKAMNFNVLLNNIKDFFFYLKALAECYHFLSWRFSLSSFSLMTP